MPAAVSNPPSHFQTLFAENWIRQTQQMTENLKRFVTIEPSLNGERKRYDIMHKRDTLSKKASRTARELATRRSEQTSSSRWLYADEYDDASLIEEGDTEQLGTLGSLESPILQEMLSNVARASDAAIIEALGATVYVGKAGSTYSRAFGAVAATVDGIAYPKEGETIAVNYTRSDAGVEADSGASTGLTVSKLRKILSLFGTAEVTTFGMAKPSEPIVVACRQKDVDWLLDDIRVTNRDYSGTLPFDSGSLEKWAGIKLLHSERFTGSNGVCSLYAWVPSGVKFFGGQWKTHIDVLPENSHCTQVRVYGRMGGLRLQPEKVIKVNVVD